MDWDDLRYFLAAYRHRSMAGAARELKCEHTTVGRRIAALEGALTTRLFLRTPGGLEPTPAADQLAPTAETIARQLHELERRTAGQDDRIDGTVRVTTSESFATFVVQRLPELRSRHDRLVVEVLADNRSLDIGRGEADIALRFARTDQPDLLVRRLIEIPWAMYASVDYLARRGRPSVATELSGHDVVGFDDALASAPGARWLAEHGAGATVSVRGNVLRAVVDAAVAGLGLAILPCQLGEPDPRLVRVFDESLGARTLCIVVHPDLARVRRVRAVIDFLVEVVTRDAPLLQLGPPRPA